MLGKTQDICAAHPIKNYCCFQVTLMLVPTRFIMVAINSRFVISLNLNRRHVDSSQKAASAVDALPFYEAEAKKGQVLGGLEKVNQKIDEPSKNRSKD